MTPTRPTMTPEEAALAAGSFTEFARMAGAGEVMAFAVVVVPSHGSQQLGWWANGEYGTEIIGALDILSARVIEATLRLQKIIFAAPAAPSTEVRQ